MGLFSWLFGKKKKEENKKTAANTATESKVASEEKTAPISVEKTAAREAKTTATDVKTPAEKPVKSTPAKAEAVKVSDDISEDAAADEISLEKDSETVKVSGLCGFFDIKKSKDGRFVFNLYASNRVIIATSQIYSSAKSAVDGANSVIANAKRANVEDQTLKNPTEAGFPKWVIYKDKAEQFRFRLLATNGSCICHSQGYTAKASCKNGIQSIIKTVENATIDKNYLTKK